MESTAAIGGHPIHAILIAFPVALFSTVLLLDLIYHLRGKDPFWAWCSYIVLVLGVLGTVAAAIPGLIDYLTMVMPPLGTRHMVVGLAVAAIFLLQVFLCRPTPNGGGHGSSSGPGVFKGRGAPRVLLPLTLLGVGLVAYQGWLGGELVYRFHVGVLPTEEAHRVPVTNTTGGGGGVSSGTVRAGSASTGLPGASSGSAGQGSAAGGAVSGKQNKGPALPAATLKMVQAPLKSQCQNCHKLQGVGGEIGPDLTHEGSQHDKNWIVVQIKKPKAHNPDTGMPAFPKMPAPQLEAMAAYLASMK